MAVNCPFLRKRGQALPSVAVWPASYLIPLHLCSLPGQCDCNACFARVVLRISANTHRALGT